MHLVIRKIKIIDFINGTIFYYNKKYTNKMNTKKDNRIEEELLFYY